MSDHPYPHFRDALTELAPTNTERAKLLGVSRRSVEYYLAGKGLPPVEKVKLIDVLDEALTRDIRPKRTQIPA